MNRQAALALFVAVGSTGCGSSMSTAPVLQPGAFNERTIDERGLERISIDFVADARMVRSDRDN